jgi:hypothetical protein
MPSLVASIWSGGGLGRSRRFAMTVRRAPARAVAGSPVSALPGGIRDRSGIRCDERRLELGDRASSAALPRVGAGVGELEHLVALSTIAVADLVADAVLGGDVVERGDRGAVIVRCGSSYSSAVSSAGRRAHRTIAGGAAPARAGSAGSRRPSRTRRCRGR